MTVENLSTKEFFEVSLSEGKYLQRKHLKWWGVTVGISIYKESLWSELKWHRGSLSVNEAFEVKGNVNANYILEEAYEVRGNGSVNYKPSLWTDLINWSLC